MEKYSSWWRGAPAKGVGRETGARVRVSPSAPNKKDIRKGIFFIFVPERYKRDSNSLGEADHNRLFAKRTQGRALRVSPSAPRKKDILRWDSQ